MAEKLGRNDPCHCGSGKKYKKCCLITEQTANAQIRNAPPNSISTRHQAIEGLKLPIPRSEVFQGRRYRAIWDEVHGRPEKETFHDFLLWLMQETLGRDWIAQQKALQHDKRHVLVAWLESFKNLATHPLRLQKGIYVTSGPMKAALMLAYDLYILQVARKLPAAVLNRLKNREEFQGARYELAVASIFARADFEIKWLSTNRPDRHCEFTARHKRTGTEISIEAKSRQRPGVLHKSGSFDETKDVKAGVRQLYESARGQGTPGQPFVIFVDVNRPTDNLPPPEPDTLSVASNRVDWMDEIETMLREDWSIDGRLPSPDTLVVVTNYCPHFGEPDAVAPPGVFAMVPSPNPKEPITDRDIVDDLFYCLRYYPFTPNEI